VLVQVSAVALNPLDWKLVHYFPRPGTVVGCDFTGTIIARGNAVTDLAIGQRVCGAVVGSNPNRPSNGACSKFLIADSRILLAVPNEWTDLQAAALGGVGWYTAGLAFYDDDALQLTGWPSCPVPAREDGSRIPILVYGGATASGTMFCQWLSRYTILRLPSSTRKWSTGTAFTMIRATC
jgi:NADPH:quinone reductase-like Zn-dependent oxidoreductase